MGCPGKFTQEEEKLIVNTLVEFSEAGMPLNKDHLRDLVHHLSEEKGAITQYTYNLAHFITPILSSDTFHLSEIPGMMSAFSNKWHLQFLSKYPQVSRRLASNIDRKKSREWDNANSESWIGLLERLHNEGFLSDPRGIINLDESPFMMGFERETVYAKRGTKQVKSYVEGSTRDQITVLFCGNAAGKMFVPLVLYDGVMLLESMVRGTQG